MIFDLFSLKYEGQIDPSPETTTLKKPSFIRVNIQIIKLLFLISDITHFDQVIEINQNNNLLHKTTIG